MARLRAGELARGEIARASAQSLGIRIAGLGLSFAQAILTARLLGAAGYGSVAAILSVVQILAMVGMFGMGPLAVREIPSGQTQGEEQQIAGFLRLSLLLVVTVSSLLALLTAFVLIPALDVTEASSESLAFAGFLIVPLALLALLRGWAQGFGRIANAQIPADVLRPGIMVAAMLFTIAAGAAFAPADYFLIAIASGGVAVVLSSLMLWRSNLCQLPWPGKEADLRETSSTALPFLLLGLASILQGEINTLLLAVLASPEETGLFQPIARLAPILMLPVLAAGMRYAPRMAELWKKGEHDRIRLITGTFTWTTTLLTLLLGVAVALAGPWLLLAFGQEFVVSAPLLWIIAVTQLFNAACGPVGIILTMGGHARAALFGHLAGLVVNFVLGWLLIEQMGALGATIAMAGGIIVWNITLLLMARQKTGIDASLVAVLFSNRTVGQ